MGKHVLITGFEPFGAANVNPSELVARSLEGRFIAERLVTVRILPVETLEIRGRLERAISEEQPDIIVALGQAGGRTAIALERAALNVLHFDRLDNAGQTRKNQPVAPDGPDARFSTLPLERICDSLSAHEVPAYVSNSAGTYICNQTLYEVLALTESAARPIVTGFVHLPYLPQQAISAGSDPPPSMSFDLMKHAMELLVEATVSFVDRTMLVPRAIAVKEIER